MYVVTFFFISVSNIYVSLMVSCNDKNRIIISQMGILKEGEIYQRNSQNSQIENKLTTPWLKMKKTNRQTDKQQQKEITQKTKD